MSEKRITWTIQPAEDVKSLMGKAITRFKREMKKRGKNVSDRGIRTLLVNEALRLQHANLRGKREQAA